MIVKREEEYYVVSQKSYKNLGDPTRRVRKQRKDFRKLNTSSIRKKIVFSTEHSELQSVESIYFLWIILCVLSFDIL